MLPSGPSATCSGFIGVPIAGTPSTMLPVVASAGPPATVTIEFGMNAEVNSLPSPRSSDCPETSYDGSTLRFQPPRACPALSQPPMFAVQVDQNVIGFRIPPPETGIPL